MRVLDFAEWTSMMKTGKVRANFQGEFALCSLDLEALMTSPPLTAPPLGPSDGNRQQPCHLPARIDTGYRTCQ